MLCVRLDEEMEKKLENLAKELHLTKSKLVKEALNEFLSKKSPYELGKNLFGKFESKEGDLSYTYKKRVKEKIWKKSS